MTSTSRDTGFEDFAFGAGVDNNANRATAEKPESKLWYHDGLWWATLYKLGRRRASHLSSRPPKRPGSTRACGSTRGHAAARTSCGTGEALHGVALRRLAAAEPSLALQLRPGVTRPGRSTGFPGEHHGWRTEALTLAKDSRGRSGSRTRYSRVKCSNRTRWERHGVEHAVVLPVAEGTTVGPTTSRPSSPLRHDRGLLEQPVTSTPTTSPSTALDAAQTIPPPGGSRSRRTARTSPTTT